MRFLVSCFMRKYSKNGTQIDCQSALSQYQKVKRVERLHNAFCRFYKIQEVFFLNIQIWTSKKMNKHLRKSWQITGNFIAHWSVSKLSALNHENKTDRDRFAVQNSTEENHQFLHLELQSYWLTSLTKYKRKK